MGNKESDLVLRRARIEEKMWIAILDTMPDLEPSTPEHNFLVSLFVITVVQSVRKFIRYDFAMKFIIFYETKKMYDSQVVKSPRYNLLRLSGHLFSSKTQKEVFLPAMADWDEEIFEALKENKDANLFMINVRNTYGFIIAMWQKSPLGDLLEYVRKFAS